MWHCNEENNTLANVHAESHCVKNVVVRLHRLRGRHFLSCIMNHFANNRRCVIFIECYHDITDLTFEFHTTESRAYIVEFCIYRKR